MREGQRGKCQDRRRQEGAGGGRSGALSTRRESQRSGDPEPWEEGCSWEHSLAVAGFTLEENRTPLWVQSTTYKENPARSRRSSMIGAETATHKQD